MFHKLTAIWALWAMLVVGCTVGFKQKMSTRDLPQIAEAKLQDLPVVKARIQRYQTIFGEIPVNDGLDFYLCQVNPRPIGDLTQFTTEILREDMGFGTPSHWFDSFFSKAASPEAQKLMPKSYYLEMEEERGSLLFYEWSDAKYSYKLYESSAGVLLRVNTVAKPLDPAKGIPREQVESILKDVLAEHIFEAKALPVGKFRLPALLKIGTVFSNNELELHAIRSYWQDIVGFISDRDVCIMLYKARPFRQLMNLPDDEYWLPFHLYEEDGQTLVIERLRREKVSQSGKSSPLMP